MRFHAVWVSKVGAWYIRSGVSVLFLLRQDMLFPFAKRARKLPCVLAIFFAPVLNTAFIHVATINSKYKKKDSNSLVAAPPPPLTHKHFLKQETQV